MWGTNAMFVCIFSFFGHVVRCSDLISTGTWRLWTDLTNFTFRLTWLQAVIQRKTRFLFDCVSLSCVSFWSYIMRTHIYVYIYLSIYLGFKLMLLHDYQNSDGIKSFFQETHELYIKVHLTTSKTLKKNHSSFYRL